jgi:long-chain acyl-CoA synthetase
VAMTIPGAKAGPPATLAEIVRGHAHAIPAAPALHLPDRVITYAELDQRSSRVANGLRSLGVDARDRIAYLGRTSGEYFELMFGAAKLNAIPVPINWRLAPREIEEILRDSEAVVLLIGEGFADAVPAREAYAPQLRHVVSVDDSTSHLHYRTWLVNHSSDDPDHISSPADIALQVYTSGTTGQPKGALISNLALMHHLTALGKVARIGPDAVTLASLPMFHVGGNAWALAGLLKGCQGALLPETVPAEILDTIHRLRVSVAFAVPAVIQMLLDAPEIECSDCSSLDTLYYGGSPITDSVLKRAIGTFGCDFVQGFGMTECGLITALGPADHDPEARPELLRSCGRVVPPNKVRLVDPATLEDTPVGAVGELWVRSPMVMSGYFNRPDETAAAITADGWLRTGDAAMADADGYFYLQDRIKDMIISGGENVYSAEVENVLMSHAGVKECAVIGVPSARWGETVTAIVVVEQASRVEGDSLIGFCRERLAHYKCPTSVSFVGSLPRTSSGKVVKHELRRLHGSSAAAVTAGPF